MAFGATAVSHLSEHVPTAAVSYNNATASAPPTSPTEQLQRGRGGWGVSEEHDACGELHAGSMVTLTVSTCLLCGAGRSFFI